MGDAEGCCVMPEAVERPRHRLFQTSDIPMSDAKIRFGEFTLILLAVTQSSTVATITRSLSDPMGVAQLRAFVKL